MEDMAIEFGDMLKDTLDKMSEKVPPFVQFFGPSMGANFPPPEMGPASMPWQMKEPLLHSTRAVMQRPCEGEDHATAPLMIAD
jgi:hypothetical protein